VALGIALFTLLDHHRDSVREFHQHERLDYSSFRALDGSRSDRRPGRALRFHIGRHQPTR
jgi:hypothetical protein